MARRGALSWPARDVDGARERERRASSVVEHGFGIDRDISLRRRLSLASVRTLRLPAPRRAPVRLPKVACRARRAPCEHAFWLSIGAHEQLKVAVLRLQIG